MPASLCVLSSGGRMDQVLVARLRRGVTVLASGLLFIVCWSPGARAQPVANNASCVASQCRINGSPSLPGFACATDADCQSLIQPACPSFPICTDASCQTTAPYQTVAGNGKCVINQDVTINKTIEVPSFVDLDCAGHTISPFHAAAGNFITGAVYKRNGSLYTVTAASGSDISTPQLALFLNGTHGSIVENCTIGTASQSFDFGMMIINSKVPAILATDPVAGRALQNQIRGNKFDSRFSAAVIAFADDNLIQGNALTTHQEGATVIHIGVSSQYNTIAGNIITELDNGFSGAPRFPGYTGPSNKLSTFCGQAVGVSYGVFGDNALCGGGAGGMLNTVVNGTLYQTSLVDPSTGTQRPLTQYTTVGPDNVFSIKPPKTFALKTTAPSTTILQNTFTGGHLAIGAATNGFLTLPGACANDQAPARSCMSDGDCDAVAGACVFQLKCNGTGNSCASDAACGNVKGACQPATTVAQSRSDGLIVDRNKITVPDAPTAGTQAVSGMSLGAASAQVTNNLLTVPCAGAACTQNPTQGIQVTATAAESAAVTIAGNTFTNLTTPLLLIDTNPVLNHAFRATITRNDLNGYKAPGVALSSPYNLPSTLSGNYWGPSSRVRSTRRIRTRLRPSRWCRTRKQAARAWPRPCSPCPRISSPKPPAPRAPRSSTRNRRPMISTTAPAPR